MDGKFLRVMDTFATLLLNLVFYVLAGIGLYALFCWTYKQGEEENHEGAVNHGRFKGT